jgi:hypothetical protein
MLQPSRSQRVKTQALFGEITKLLESITFKDISKDSLKKNFFRDSKVTVMEMLMLLLGKAHMKQGLGVAAILSDLKMDGFMENSRTRSSLYYRIAQVNPEVFQELLLSINRPKENTPFLKCYFDGTSMELPHSKEIEKDFPKTKTGKGKRLVSESPMAKLHFIASASDHRCVDVLMKDHDYNERVALVELGVRARDRGESLYLIADRGLYGSATGHYLQALGHKFSLRCGGALIKKFKKKKFKEDSITLELKHYRSSLKPYKKFNLERIDKEFTCRIVRKKGTSKRKAIYVMTNDYESSAESILFDYRDRQRIEDQFKYMKSYGGLEKVHPNTSKHMLLLIIPALIFYNSVQEKLLFQMMPTANPSQKGEFIFNRRLCWGLLFTLMKHYRERKFLLAYQTEALSNLLIIRPGRRAQRYIVRHMKIKV